MLRAPAAVFLCLFQCVLLGAGSGVDPSPDLLQLVAAPASVGIGQPGEATRGAPSRTIRIELCEIDGAPIQEAQWAWLQQPQPPENSGLATREIANFRPDGQGGLVARVPRGIDLQRPYRLNVGPLGDASRGVRLGDSLTRDPYLARVAELEVLPTSGGKAWSGSRDLGELRFGLPEPVVDVWLGAPQPGSKGPGLAQLEIGPVLSPGGYSGSALTPNFTGLVRVPGRVRLYGEGPMLGISVATFTEWDIWARVPGEARLRRRRVPVGDRAFARLEPVHTLEIEVRCELPERAAQLVLLSVEPRAEPLESATLGPYGFRASYPLREHLIERWLPRKERRHFRREELLEGEYVIELWAPEDEPKREPRAHKRFELSGPRSLQL